MSGSTASSITDSVTDRLSVLSENSRLRLLRVLELEEMSVGELSSILQLPQSTASRHLKVLFEGGWVMRRTERTAGRYWLDLAELPPSARSLWELVRDQMTDTAQARQDMNRMEDVLAQRRMDTVSYFGEVGAEWSEIRRELFGERFTEESMLALLPSDWVIADVGCGTGEMTALVAPFLAHVHAVDMSEPMLKAARKRLHNCNNVSFHCAEINELPFKDSELDAVCVSLVLHHVRDVPDCIRELIRVLQPHTGRLMIVDMVEHQREEYRRRMGHQHLGFIPEQLEQLLIDNGLQGVRTHRITSENDARGPELFIAAGHRA